MKKLNKISSRALEIASSRKKSEVEIPKTSRDSTSRNVDESSMPLQIGNFRPGTSSLSQTTPAAMDVLMQEKERHKELSRNRSLDLARCLCAVPLNSVPARPKGSSENSGAPIHVGGRSLLPSQQQHPASSFSAHSSLLQRSLDQELSEFDRSTVLRSIRMMDRSASGPTPRAPPTGRISLLAPDEAGGGHGTVDSGFSAFVPARPGPGISRYSRSARSATKHSAVAPAANPAGPPAVGSRVAPRRAPFATPARAPVSPARPWLGRQPKRRVFRVRPAS